MRNPYIIYRTLNPKIATQEAEVLDRPLTLNEMDGNFAALSRAISELNFALEAKNSDKNVRLKNFTESEIELRERTIESYNQSLSDIEDRMTLLTSQYEDEFNALTDSVTLDLSKKQEFLDENIDSLDKKILSTQTSLIERYDSMYDEFANALQKIIDDEEVFFSS